MLQLAKLRKKLSDFVPKSVCKRASPLSNRYMAVSCILERCRSDSQEAGCARTTPLSAVPTQEPNSTQSTAHSTVFSLLSYLLVQYIAFKLGTIFPSFILVVVPPNVLCEHVRILQRTKKSQIWSLLHVRVQERKFGALSPRSISR